MRSKRTIASLLLLLTTLSFGERPAQALSCMAPEMTEEVYATSAAIFIGRMVADRPASRAERQRLEERGLGGIDPDKIRLFELIVERAWKGATSGRRVLVARDTYWGDGFSPEVSYLVVADSRAGEIFLVGLCSNTQPLDSASPQVEFLERIAR